MLDSSSMSIRTNEPVRARANPPKPTPASTASFLVAGARVRVVTGRPVQGRSQSQEAETAGTILKLNSDGTVSVWVWV